MRLFPILLVAIIECLCASAAVAVLPARDPLAFVPEAGVPEAVESAALAALRRPGAHLALRWEKAPACAAHKAELQRPLTGSARVAVKVTGEDGKGAPCQAWAFLKATVTAPVLVTQRPLRAGDALAGAVDSIEREIGEGSIAVSILPEGALASRALPAGSLLDETCLRDGGPLPGEPITVVVRSGALELSQPGRAVPCARGRACALLPSGKRVEGNLEGGRLVVIQ